MAKTGNSPVNPPEKHVHMKHFDEALKDALSQWDANDGTDIRVRFQIEVTPNPGGIKNYKVIIGE